MKIITLDEVDSTHKYLKSYLKENPDTKKLCIFTQKQTNGEGSRGNSWAGKEGNLFFSFVLAKEFLVDDLPLQSASIYFSYLLKKCLKEMGSALWLKWPNDFYINDKKIGGTITNYSKNSFICGIGINLIEVDRDYGFLDININKIDLLHNYFKKLDEKISWKQIFSEYKIEYKLSLKYKATISGKKMSLEKSELNSDGSISINNNKVFSLR
ncbi:MAG: biotin--[acetyl-CoA-carboxylase] ligase [Campylobacteraceae bacterium]|nr:biotin--[acetyl-CoA-carboxylase] ligase [Campylobacteraceae bacterium]